MAVINPVLEHITSRHRAVVQEAREVVEYLTKPHHQHPGPAVMLNAFAGLQQSSAALENQATASTLAVMWGIIARTVVTTPKPTHKTSP